MRPSRGKHRNEATRADADTALLRSQLTSEESLWKPKALINPLLVSSIRFQQIALSANLGCVPWSQTGYVLLATEGDARLCLSATIFVIRYWKNCVFVTF